MAAQVLLLLLALLSDIHAEVIRRAGGSHDFRLDDAADFCSVSRWTGEGKDLLLNSSASYYGIYSLNESHSGKYLEQCWTRGNLTLQRNSTLLVCDDRKMMDHRIGTDVGQTVELTCDSVGPNQSVQWAYERPSKKLGVLIDDGTPSEYEHQLVKSEPSLLVTVDKYSEDVLYYCLEKQQRRCEVHSRFYVSVPPEFVFHSVGESLELNCSDVRGNQTHQWRIHNLRPYTESLNYTLVIPSLTLAHTGGYHCEPSVSASKYHYLFVCPEPEPPAVALFTGGESLTLPCGNWEHAAAWFMRSNRTGGRVTQIDYKEREWPDRLHISDTSMEIRNVSLQDSGEFWCVVMKDDRCVFRYDTLVMFGEPEVGHHLVRSVLLGVVMLMMPCVVVVVEVWRSRRRGQPPAPVEELEMSQLAPESDVQEETPV